MSKLILCFGRDPILTETRRMVLQKAGFTCHTVQNLEELKRCLTELTVDVLVICHSASDEECEVAKNLAHIPQHPALVLVLSAGRRFADADGTDAFLDSREGPESLLRTVLALLREHGRDTPGPRHNKPLRPTVRREQLHSETVAKWPGSQPSEGD